MGFSNLEFLGQIALFECCVRGAAPTSSPCLIRPVHDRERVRGMKETSAKWPTCCTSGGSVKRFFGHWRTCRALTNITLKIISNVAIFPSWQFISSRQRFLYGRLKAFALSEILRCVVAFRYRIFRSKPIVQGAAPTPLARLPPFPTWPCTRATGGEKEKRKFTTVSDSSVDVFLRASQRVAC